MEPTTVVIIVFAALTVLSLVLHLVRPTATVTKVVDAVTPIIEKTITEIVSGGTALHADTFARPLVPTRFGSARMVGGLGMNDPWGAADYLSPPMPHAQTQAILPFVSVDDKGNDMPCPNGKVVEVRARPQGPAFRMTDIVIDEDANNNFVVHDIMVGPSSQFAQRKHPVSLTALASRPFTATTAQTGMDIIMHVEYVGPEEAGNHRKVFRIHALGDVPN